MSSKASNELGDVGGKEASLRIGALSSLSSCFSYTLEVGLSLSDRVSTSGFDSSFDSVLARPRVGVGVEDVDIDGSYREKDLVVVDLEGLPFPTAAIVGKGE